MVVAKNLIAQLDKPALTPGNINVIYLRNAEATRIAPLLRAIISSDPSFVPPTAGSGLSPATGTTSGPGMTTQQQTTLGGTGAPGQQPTGAGTGAGGSGPAVRNDPGRCRRRTR